MWWTFWLPGFITAALVGAASIVILVLMGAWGWALWLAAPLAAAALLGYRVRVHIISFILLGIIFVSPLIGTAMMMNVAGMFCGLILAGIFIVPILLGLGAGAAVRFWLKNSSFSQREYLPILIALLVPILCGLIEKQTTPAASPERISTTRVIDAPVDAVWQSIMFYEEVEHEPPLLLRIGLAHPLATTGSSREVGDIKTCLYNKGRISKQITAVERHRLLAFTIIEQSIGYERDVRLTGGRFEFESIGDNRTRVTLTTEYEPLLSPRFAWRWGERLAVHTLHEHVLKGMAIESERLGRVATSGRRASR